MGSNMKYREHSIEKNTKGIEPILTSNNEKMKAMGDNSNGSKTYLFRQTLMFLLCLSVLGSCNDFLDEVPDNRVELNDLDKAAQLLTNAYSIASPAFTDVMADDINEWTTGTTIRLAQLQLYTWQDVTAAPDEQDTPDFFWYETYGAIAHANEVLAVLDKLPYETEEEKSRRDAVESEALLTRAYGHFMLVNLFGDHYFPQSASSSKGVPYINKPETEFLAEYRRRSVSKVYDDIEDDLLEGLELVNDNFFANSGKYHFNRNAALAFASRFYLFKRDYVRCVQYSNELLGGSPTTFVRDMTSDDFQNASSLEYPRTYNSPDDPSNLLLMRKVSFVHVTSLGYGYNRNTYGGLFAANPYVGTSDQRENPAFVQGQNALIPVRYENLFQRNSLNSNVGTPYHIYPAFRGEEVLLNRAEANISLNNLDESLADLEVLAGKRYTGSRQPITPDLIKIFFRATDDPSFTDQVAVLNMILLERRKEFVLQGMRWFDLKRYGISIEHTLADGVSTIELRDGDPRFALQIPQSAVVVGGLDPNPR